MRCLMVFVAVDENRQPVEVPTWQPVSDSDIAMEKYAHRIMELRKVNQENLNSFFE